MRLKLIIATWGLLLASTASAWAVGEAHYVDTQGGPEDFALAKDGKPSPWLVSSDDHPGVLRVARLVRADVEAITGKAPVLSDGSDAPTGDAVVLVGTLGKSPLIDDLVARGKFNAEGLAGRWDTFVTQVVDDPLPGVARALVIAGSDKRGTIFGMFDLSAEIGVSPWNWWADVPVRKQANLYVLAGRHSRGEPKVKYRGIFINDEAPALANWMQEKFGGCNHKFYDHVFELILRLKGNYLWPAMWGRAIYDDDPESPRLADEYGIVIGTSHHEPMMRAHIEWSRHGEGPWNYEKNRDRLREFWREGVARMGRYESVVTVGMRGDGDEPMSEKANIALLEKIITDQRGIIAEVTGKPPDETPQMWALYKEVQEYYDRGVRVPDDVMLLLCDDNWGNIRKLPKLGDKPRAGGYGVYYHFDYVGGPRNYKWLNTNSLPRVWEQMHLAYEYDARRLWIVNVGDIKPMELPISFFLDYAWDPEAWPAERLPEYGRLWAEQQFGAEHAAEIADLLAEYAKYNARRKPELLEPGTYSLLHEREAERVVADFNELAAQARRIGELLPHDCRDAYFQLVQFPIEACANVNELYVTAARNRLYAEQGRVATNELADRVTELFLRDAKLVRIYNDDLADGKWRHMMDQTHIGYTSWQEPPRNVAPKTERIDVPAEAAMGVAAEGSNAWWPRDDATQRLAFTPYDSASSRRIDIFNRGRAAFDYRIECDAAWIQLDHTHGMVQDEDRVEVSVDWSKAPEGAGEAKLTIVGGGEESVVVHISTAKPQAAEVGAIRGFVEADGVIAIEAEHASRTVDAAPIRWQVIPDLGRTLSGMTVLPVTAPRQTPGGDAPRLEYAIHLFNAGELRVKAYASPTLDFTAGDGRRYAVSIDDGEPQIVNINVDDSLQAWERHVADNINISETKHTVTAAGAHTLKFWMVDPGVVLQRLVVEISETRPTYLGPRESFLATGN
jgi:hypothetical protein